uniref:Uncharacterized protein n=1 Tax=Leersia perrieri TaxID=77586 RepID=A0A0D9XBP8_9ORYZ
MPSSLCHRRQAPAGLSLYDDRCQITISDADPWPPRRRLIAVPSGRRPSAPPAEAFPPARSRRQFALLSR